MNLEQHYAAQSHAHHRMLAEADPRAALSLLRTWAMAPKPQQKRAKGAVLLGTYTEPKARMAERGWAMGDLGGVGGALASSVLVLSSPPCLLCSHRH